MYIMYFHVELPMLIHDNSYSLGVFDFLLRKNTCA